MHKKALFQRTGPRDKEYSSIYLRLPLFRLDPNRTVDFVYYESFVVIIKQLAHTEFSTVEKRRK